MENLKIFIPAPCHENWDTMSPAAKGRFCSSCKKTVVDFSDKSKSEVINIISEKKDEKICGRFRNQQLAETVKIQISLGTLLQTKGPYQVFAMALLLVFGTSLFSCTTPKGDVVGEIALVKPPPVEKTYTVDVVSFTTGLSCQAPLIIESDTTVEIEDKSTCETQFMEDTVQLQTVDVSDKLLSYDFGNITVGAITICNLTDYNVMMEDTDSVSNKEAALPVNIATEINVYPNPSSGIVNLKLEHLKAGNLVADLFDLKGSLIRNVIPPQYSAIEELDLPINLSEQPPGVYLVKVTSGEKNWTKRIIISR